MTHRRAGLPERTRRAGQTRAASRRPAAHSRCARSSTTSASPHPRARRLLLRRRGGGPSHSASTPTAAAGSLQPEDTAGDQSIAGGHATPAPEPHHFDPAIIKTPLSETDAWEESPDYWLRTWGVGVRAAPFTRRARRGRMPSRSASSTRTFERARPSLPSLRCSSAGAAPLPAPLTASKTRQQRALAKRHDGRLCGSIPSTEMAEFLPVADQSPSEATVRRACLEDRATALTARFNSQPPLHWCWALRSKAEVYRVNPTGFVLIF